MIPTGSRLEDWPYGINLPTDVSERCGQTVPAESVVAEVSRQWPHRARGHVAEDDQGDGGTWPATPQGRRQRARLAGGESESQDGSRVIGGRGGGLQEPGTQDSGENRRTHPATSTAVLRRDERGRGQ